MAWPVIARGGSALLVAPTGSGKTLAAFLWCVNRLLFEPAPPEPARCRVLYVSPIKALAVDIERNLQAPLQGIVASAARRGDPVTRPTVSVRSGDTPAAERAGFRRHPSDILITTPESLYLLLTSQARRALASIDTVIIDEIHALVPNKRGAHLALSLERLEALCTRSPQRLGLSATQRPLDEVARFLGGAGSGHLPYRPVELVDAGQTRPLRLTVDLPVHTSAQNSIGAPPRTPARSLAGAPSPRAASLAGPLRGPLPNDRSSAAPDAPDDAAVRPSANGTARAAARERSEVRGGPGQRPGQSMWAAIHPRLLELIRAHQTTLIFVNSRRLAERLAGALNDLAGETLVRSHHGSLAREQRLEVEERLKAGALRALVATSSLELGIDMGAIDLVIQIEAPPSVARGLQRIGRSGHRTGAVSDGVIVPKYRGDLVACAAVTAAMHAGAIEATRYPRNPLDVLAQHIVAMVAMDDWPIDDLFAVVRGAAPFAELGRSAFEQVLDMLSGRYESDAFAALKPRVTWHRRRGLITAREGTRRVAVVNGGAIPDRGLYGVFLTGGAERGRGRASTRVGELDEEMVFESRVGDVFLLGASSWRIDAITHDRVLVSPAPGQPGRMPFWHGDGPGRPIEFGLAIGRLARELTEMPAPAAHERLTTRHDLNPRAADTLLEYLREQRAATGAVPSDETIVVERSRDETGDWRVSVLSPLGSRVHAPWAMAVEARVRQILRIDVETMWGDDGFVVRFPDSDEPPDPALLLPPADEIVEIVTREVGGTALFASRFREVAGRALLLPRRRPGQRTPLWQQRKRAADLLATASQFASFPAILETFRECLHDVFDLPALEDVLRRLADRSLRLVIVDVEHPSPFAASLLFNYVANYIYEGDTPLAERRAQALAVDQAQLRELVGDAELRDLIDPMALEELERDLQRLGETGRVRHADGIHDLLLRLGDLTRAEIVARSEHGAGTGAGPYVNKKDEGTARETASHPLDVGAAPRGRPSSDRETASHTLDVGADHRGRPAPRWVSGAIRQLVDEERAIAVTIAHDTRYIAAEDASRYRDALGCALPDLPAAFTTPVPDPMGDLLSRYARTHGPFTSEDAAARFGLKPADVDPIFARLARDGRLIEGQFRPGGRGREWCEPDVLASLRRRSRARLRHEVAPVAPEVLQRLAVTWHGLVSRRASGPDALLEAIETIQGAAVPASTLEDAILRARVDDYDPADLDRLASAGALVWIGVGPLGTRDGRVSLYLAEHLAALLPPRVVPSTLPARERAILEHLRARGASFFGALHESAGGGYPGETLTALWNLVWLGLVTNDSFHALRTRTQPRTQHSKHAAPTTAIDRPRRLGPPSSEGRWWLVESLMDPARTPTAWSAAICRQLLARHGVLTREAITAEGIPGGFASVLDTLRALDERGRVHRGYFVAGLGGMQFALPAALDLLRARRDEPEAPEVVTLAATDPASLYGSVIAWPPAATDADGARTGRGPTRSVGAYVILVDGTLAAYVGRRDRPVFVNWPADLRSQQRIGRAVAGELMRLARSGGDEPRGMLLAEINGTRTADHPLAPYLREAGFLAGARGFHAPKATAPG
jgi:ATP-dependent Lhr-like helicase